MGGTSRAGSEEFCTPSRSSAHQPAARMHMDAQQLIGGGLSACDGPSGGFAGNVALA